MLKKSLRIDRRGLEVFFSARGGSKPRSFYGKIVAMRARRNNSTTNRFAFVVSGPKTRAAHLRNLARRRMAEAVRTMLKIIPPGRDVVFFLKLNERKVPSFAALKEDIKNVISQNIL